MSFSSAVFLFGFLPVLLCMYYVVRSNKWKNILLLLASLFFYAWGEPKNVFIMLLSILVNYGIGRWMEQGKRRKILLAAAAAYNIGILFIFKYLNFSIDIWNLLTKKGMEFPEIILPIGISFYTFQILSYIIDVYRKKISAQRNVLKFALYVSLFPQLIAGPIVRYADIERQINSRTIKLDNLYLGTRRFMIGFVKKILFADQLAILADMGFSASYPSVFVNWAGILAYTLQIFFDFSGYSDMAIGLGKLFGFDFLENFNYPYIAKSIREFWRRWHISLGSWFRDYVYIPLSGSRKGTFHTCINLTIVFFLTGLWHGASWNFILWGLFYAVFLIVERLGFAKILKKLPEFFQHFYTLLIVITGWVFFRADNLSSAFDYLKGMFHTSGRDFAYFQFVMNGQYWFCLIAGMIFAMPRVRIKELLSKNAGIKYINDVLMVLAFLLAICYMIGSGYSPFLYFRF